MDIDYKQLAEAMLAARTEKAVPGTTPTAAMGHGNGGLFSYPGMEKPIFSAMLLPQTGLQSLLPVKPSNTENPVYGILTGVTATTGDEPTGVCDDPPYAGLAKLCKHTFVWGRQSRRSRVYDIDQFGRTTNRGEFNDFELYGNPFAANPSSQVPTMPGFNPNAVAQNSVAKALFELGAMWARDFARLIYSGSPANNTAGGGAKYFMGLDTLINTGYTDAETNVACPAADSIVRSFGDLRVESNGQTAINEITYITRNLAYIARNAGLTPATWVIAMRWGLFYELTAIWPCNYLTYRCSNPDTADIDPVGSYNTAEAIRLRDDMRAGSYLLIDGVKWPVVTDEGITETEPVKGVFESTIYFVPLKVLTNIPVTYMEYFDYNVANGPLDAAKMFAPDGSYFTSDNGRFMWHRKPPTNFCVELLVKTEPRLLLLTPYIAAVLTDVRYSPLLHERESFTDAGYFVNGGGTSRLGYGPSLYKPSVRQ